MPQPAAVFRRAYPPPLQQMVDHARRLSLVLEGLKVERIPEEGARLWLHGRNEEIAAFLADLVIDWSAGTLALEAATESGAAYLRALHTAATGLFLLPDPGPCCDSGASGAGSTAEPFVHDAANARPRPASPSKSVP